MPAHDSETAVLQACRVLFGPEVSLSREFLSYLQVSGAKAAFRKRAKETHPDLSLGKGRGKVGDRSESFRDLNQAYHIVVSFLKERDRDSRQGVGGRMRRTSNGRDCGGADKKTRGTALSFPPRPLEIGLFLYYKGIISYRDLAEALAWQRKQRPAFGAIARRWGWLDEAAVKRITGSGSRGPFRRFGEKALWLGLLSPFQIKTLLFYQRSQQQLLGQFFVDRGLISPDDLDRLVVEQRIHNASIAAAKRRGKD